MILVRSHVGHGDALIGPTTLSSRGLRLKGRKADRYQESRPRNEWKLKDIFLAPLALLGQILQLHLVSFRLTLSSESSSKMAAGWALRKNGTCASDETNCGMKARPFYGCCPEGTSCPDQYNIACCPESGNCTLSLLPDPQCANREWDLYDNNGFFCCLKGLTGYSAQNGRSSGCAEPGYRLSTDERFLSIVSSGTGKRTHLSGLRKWKLTYSSIVDSNADRHSGARLRGSGKLILEHRRDRGRGDWRARRPRDPSGRHMVSSAAQEETAASRRRRSEHARRSAPLECHLRERRAAGDASP